MKSLNRIFAHEQIVLGTLLVIVISLISSLLAKLIVLGLFIVIVSYQFKIIPWFLIILSSLFLLRQHHSLASIDFTNSVIIEITESQTIFQSGIFKASSFGIDYGSIGDVVHLDATLSFHQDIRYQVGLLLKNNIGQLTIDSLEIIGSKKIFRNLIPNSHDIVRFYLFPDTQSFDTNESIMRILLSSGLHFSSSMNIIRQASQRFFFRKQVNRIELIYSLILMILFGLQFITLRLVVQSVVRMSHIEFKKRLFIEIIIILFLYPMAVSSPSFLLVYLMKASKFMMSKQHVNYQMRLSYIAMIQLNLFYRFNFLESLLYPAFRFISGILFLISLISVFLPIYPFLEAFHSFISVIIISINIEILTIVGQPIMVLNIIWLMVILIKKYQKFSLIMIYAQSIFLLLNSSVSIAYLNVGQGDATLIRYPHLQGAILVDTGKSNQYYTLKSELYRLGVKSIDSLIITHPDSDHNGSQHDVVRDFNVDQVIEQADDYQGSLNINFLLNNRVNMDTNDMSLMFMFQVNQTKFLFTGDASKDIEKMLLKKHPNIRADIVKLGHHGSKTSSDFKYLQTIQPKLALISSDPKLYNHPHLEVLNTLYTLGIPSLQTSQSGTIEIIVTRYFTFVKTTNGLYLLN